MPPGMLGATLQGSLEILVDMHLLPHFQSSIYLSSGGAILIKDFPPLFAAASARLLNLITMQQNAPEPLPGKKLPGQRL